MRSSTVGEELLLKAKIVMATAATCIRRLLQQTSATHFRCLPVCRRARLLPSSSLGTMPSITTAAVVASQESSADVTSVDKPLTLRRALMYVPAADERKTRKAASLKVDTIVFDLEDGVAANQKDNARRLVRGAVANCRLSGSVSADAELVVRVNGVESGMLHQDLNALFGEGSHDPSSLSHDYKGGSPDAIMLPKVENVEHLLELDISLSFHRGPTHQPLPLFILVESPLGLLNLREVCALGAEKARNLRITAVVFGSDDYLARVGGIRTKDAREVLFARQAVVTEAKAFGLDAIDLVDTDYKDLDSLRAQAEEGARMGYTGKQVIHPSQVPVVQRAFSPSQEQVQWASGLIQAFHQHQQSGKGAFVYEGHMIDRPLLLQAMNIMHRADATPS